MIISLCLRREELIVNNEDQEPFHLKSVVHRDKDGNIRKISVEKAEEPRFHTPAYDEIVKKGIPHWLRKIPE